jgi:hypothetical protein
LPGPPRKPRQATATNVAARNVRMRIHNAPRTGADTVWRGGESGV